jgi:hypothetical protein
MRAVDSGPVEGTPANGMRRNPHQPLRRDRLHLDVVDVAEMTKGYGMMLLLQTVLVK